MNRLETWAGGRRALFALLAVLVMAAAFRFALVAAMPVIVRSDGIEYHGYALNLARGEGFHYVYQSRTESLRGFDFKSYRPPGYSFFLAGIYVFTGDNPRAVMWVQALLDLIVLLLVFAIGRRLLPPPWPMLAAAAYALWVFWTPVIMTESFSTFMFALFIYFLLAESPDRPLLGPAVTGLVLGLNVLTRPLTGIFLLPAFILYGLRRPADDRFHRPDRPALRRLLVFSAVWVITISPWLVRNYVVNGEFVFICNNSGLAFFDANHAGGAEESDRIFSEAMARGYNESQLNQFFYDETLKFLREHPQKTFRRKLVGLYNLFSLAVPGELRRLMWAPLSREAKASGFDAAVFRAGSVAFWATRVVQTLAYCGIIVAAFRFRRWLGPLMLMAVFTVASVYYQGKPRYMAPFFPLLAVFFALTLEAAATKISLVVGRAGGRKNSA